MLKWGRWYVYFSTKHFGVIADAQRFIVGVAAPGLGVAVYLGFVTVWFG